MSFQFQRRLELSKGLGINIGKSGFSLSSRSQYGSVGTSGFSIRTGIPGLSFRKRWGKNNGLAMVIMLIAAFIQLIPIAAVIAWQLMLLAYWLLIVIPYKIIQWAALTFIDYRKYKANQQREPT